MALGHQQDGACIGAGHTAIAIDVGSDELVGRHRRSTGVGVAAGGDFQGRQGIGLGDHAGVAGAGAAAGLQLERCGGHHGQKLTLFIGLANRG